MLLKSWAQSLSLLSPKTFKLFLLVTLKGVFDICISTKVWLSLFIPFLFLYGDISPTAAISLCLLFMFLMARPSVRLKNMSYLRSYFFRYSSLVIIASVMLFIVARLYNTALLWYLVYLVGPFAPITVFTILFLLDSQNSIGNIFTSLYRGVKLVFYNAPIMILFYLLWIVCLIPFFRYIIDFILNTYDINQLELSLGKHFFLVIGNRLWALGVWYVFVVLITFLIALLTNYYVKQIHDNFSLYE